VGLDELELIFPSLGLTLTVRYNHPRHYSFYVLTKLDQNRVAPASQLLPPPTSTAVVICTGFLVLSAVGVIFSTLWCSMSTKTGPSYARA